MYKLNNNKKAFKKRLIKKDWHTDNILFISVVFIAIIHCWYKVNINIQRVDKIPDMKYLCLKEILINKVQKK